jgi:hypothetical protein
MFLLSPYTYIRLVVGINKRAGRKDNNRPRWVFFLYFLTPARAYIMERGGWINNNNNNNLHREIFFFFRKWEKFFFIGYFFLRFYVAHFDGTWGMSVLLHPKLAVCTALFLSPLSAYLAISIYTHIIIILLQRRRRRRRKNSFRFFYDGHVRA